MKIRTQIQLLLSAILLLTASCSSCEQHNIKSAPDAYGAKLATQQAMLGGGVVHGTALHALIKVAGTIQENFHEEQTLAGIIVIPDGADIKTAAEELRDKGDPQEINTYTELLSGKGFAYYGSHVAEKQQGAVTITTLSETIPLQAATTYDAYCILRRTQTGCVYYSPAGMSFTTPDLTTFPTIQMQRADVTKNPTNTIQLDLTSDVTPGTATIKRQGFLLTKQGGTDVEPRALVASLLRENKPLPTATGLQPWDSNPDAIHAAGTISATAIEALSILDTSSLLQRGATYDVCSYAVCEDHGQDYYIFSPNTKPATILKTVAELQMDTASILKLVNTADPHLDTLTLKFEGQITRQEDTTNPIIGFLATTSSDTARARSILASSLASLSTATPPDYDTTASGDIIYRAGSVAAATTGSPTWQGDATALLPAMKGQDYHVYCWLADHGEVFISGNSKELKVPKADVNIGRPESEKGIKEALEISVKAEITNERNCTYIEKGFLFVKHGHSLDQAILQDVQRQSLSPRVASKVVMVPGFASGIISVLKDNDYGLFAETTSYSVYAWLLCDNNALFVSAAGSSTVQTYTKNKLVGDVIKIDIGTEHYQVDRKDYKVRKKDGGGNLMLLKKATDTSEIGKVLRKIFFKNGAPNTTEINNFISRMHP